jgi:hypothetical protein
MTFRSATHQDRILYGSADSSSASSVCPLVSSFASAHFEDLDIHEDLVVHLGESIRFRLWWLLAAAVLGGLAEVIDRSGRCVPMFFVVPAVDTPYRFWSSQSPHSLNPFLM